MELCSCFPSCPRTDLRSQLVLTFFMQKEELIFLFTLAMREIPFLTPSSKLHHGIRFCPEEEAHPFFHKSFFSFSAKRATGQLVSSPPPPKKTILPNVFSSPCGALFLFAETQNGGGGNKTHTTTEGGGEGNISFFPFRLSHLRTAAAKMSTTSSFLPSSLMLPS